MDHRKTPARKVLTLPGWIIILSALVCLGAASYYAVLVVNDNNGTTSAKPAANAATTVPPTATPTSAPTTRTTPQQAEETTAAPVARDIAVGVFNNTGTAGLAQSAAAKVLAAGWKVATVSNWRGVISETTVYYPPGFEEQAQTLARDLDVGRVKPLVLPMRSDRLSLILSGPQ
ncbi:MAG: LytR C-terminal domain-containing protein [Kineosporiaceae bacterium]|nr:LytR C-terminal domain-containing protein [Aeromicrobium sp.]